MYYIYKKIDKYISDSNDMLFFSVKQEILLYNLVYVVFQG